MTRYAHMPEGTVVAVYDRKMEQTEIAGHVVKGYYLDRFTPEQLTMLSLVKIGRADRPIFNPETERLELVPCAVGAEAPLDTWRVVALTAEEQQFIQDQLAKEQHIADIKADALYQDLATRLSSATPAQIASYVDTNMTSLAAGREIMKRVLLLVAGMLRD